MSTTWRILIIVSALGVAQLFSGGTVLVGNAQEGECAVRVIPRVEDGHPYYEIVGAGLPANQRVQFSWRQVTPPKPEQQRPSAPDEVASTTPECAALGESSALAQRRVSRSYIGKDSEGNFCQLPPGEWEVRAEVGSCVAETKFTVPLKGKAGVPVGVWGGQDIGLRVTETITAIDFFCARGAINQPLVPDSSGSFDVQGKYSSAKLGGALDPLPAHYTGRIDGKKMTLNVTVDNITQAYTLTLGETPPPLPACR